MTNEIKINSAELMSEEQLDNIAGGSYSEIAKDSFELYDRKFMDDHYTSLGTFFHYESYSAKVDGGWAKAGVHVVTHFAFDNEYYIKGKKVDRSDAIEHLEKFKQRAL